MRVRKETRAIAERGWGGAPAREEIRDFKKAWARGEIFTPVIRARNKLL